MSSSSSSVDSKGVFDVENRFLGRVVGAESNDRTSEPTSLLVELDANTARDFDVQAGSCWIPYDRVASIRRDEIHLSASAPRLLDDADRAEAPGSVGSPTA